MDHGTIIGPSRAMRRALELAHRLAPTGISVLIIGPTGVGKELIARELHRLSCRAGQLVDIDCGAIPNELIEGELFGSRKGSYTGSANDVSGLIAEAHLGTLFLDELTSLPLQAQVKLLRVLETREVRRVGDRAKRAIDFRLICAAQDNILQFLQSGRFRPDLYHRAARAVIRLPPLLERMEDVLPLAEHFARRYGLVVASSAHKGLLSYSWPGNVRELAAVIDQAALVAEGGVVDSESLAEAITVTSTYGGWSERQTRSGKRLSLDRESITAAGEATGWDVPLMVDRLSVGRATLYRLFRRFGIRRSLEQTISEREEDHRQKAIG